MTNTSRALGISKAAAASGVSAKMIRHYEQVGLLPPPMRTAAGYRQFDDNDVHTLQFIRRARDLGFSVRQIRSLVDLWRDRQRPSREVRSLAQAQIADLDRKLAEIQAMQRTLKHLVDCCRGDDRPECPILDSLAAPSRT